MDTCTYLVTNTSLDYTKAMLHRRASRLEMEPTIAGRRLRLRDSIVLSEAQFENSKEILRKLEEQGVISVLKRGESTVPAQVVKVEPPSAIEALLPLVAEEPEVKVEEAPPVSITVEEPPHKNQGGRPKSKK